ncbi:MAG TPA: hypothetical protein VF534_01240 [Paraburkholderia sp.]
MTQTLEQYLRDELANSGAIDFAVRATVTDKRVSVYIHPANRAGMTIDFVVDGNTLRPAGEVPYGGLIDAVGPLLGEDGALLAEPIGTAEDLAASVAP